MDFTSGGSLQYTWPTRTDRTPAGEDFSPLSSSLISVTTIHSQTTPTSGQFHSHTHQLLLQQGGPHPQHDIEQQYQPGMSEIFHLTK